MILRMSGAGNTFTILDQLSDLPDSADWSARAQELCAQSPTTDGFLVLWKSPDYDFQWDFYNNDGSRAEMCGNAARCAARYYLEKSKKESCTFLTKAGLISGKWASKSEDQISVSLTPIQNLQARFLAQTLAGTEIQGTFLNTGVPHFVIEHEPDRTLAVALRASHSFGASGANITFSQAMGPHRTKAVTFERGVEDFTLACGTGAVAAAYAHFEKNSAEASVVVEMPGGELEVKKGTPPTLTGPAIYIGDHS
ncbi:MAG: diaminopimelate epimerase [Pseudobdellovibrionaceae bacterium]